MGVLREIFGGNKSIADEVLDGIDSNTLTTQEVIEYRLKSYDKLLPFKLMQRYGALLFCIPYLVAWCLVFLIRLCGYDVPDVCIEMLEGRMGVIVSMIAGFYYLGGTISGAINRK